MSTGLAGAPAEVIEAARDTAMNPAVLEALRSSSVPRMGRLLSRHSWPRADRSAAQGRAHAITQAMNEARRLLPAAGSYVSE